MYYVFFSYLAEEVGGVVAVVVVQDDEAQVRVGQHVGDAHHRREAGGGGDGEGLPQPQPEGVPGHRVVHTRRRQSGHALVIRQDLVHGAHLRPHKQRQLKKLKVFSPETNETIRCPAL
eukprot:4818280-Pyramimonas_sp.AAC.1